MNVKLIAVTKADAGIMDGNFANLTAEELIVFTARVSNPSNQHNKETADKLIGYLIRNKHWSPFEMADMTVEIKTSRAIAAQILRHRSFSFQEFSQRYAEVQEIEPVQLRRQAETNRQSSLEAHDPTIMVDGKPVLASRLIHDHIAAGLQLYKDLLNEKVAKEVARMILPLTTGTTIYMKGSIRSWIHYLQIRTDEHTQLEHRQIALAIAEIFRVHFPNIYNNLWPDDKEAV